MALYNSFTTAKQYGKKGEEVVYNYLAECGYLMENLTNDSNYYTKGDLLAENPISGGRTYIEVKTDSWADKTGNLVVELYTDYTNRKQGWFKVCQADWFFFYLENSNELISIKASELKDSYKKACFKLQKTYQVETDVFADEPKVGVIGFLKIDVLSKLPSFRRIQL